MHISLRSHLTAGTAAVVAVGAIAATPAPATSPTLPSVNVSSVAQVALAAFSSPLAQLFATADLANNYLFDPVSDPLNAASWPNANFGTTFGTPPVNYPLLPAALATSSLGGYSSVGLVSQIIDDALPIISQLGYNGLDYINYTGNAVFFAGATLTQAVWDAVGEALMGDLPGALATISGAVSAAGSALLGAGSFVLQSVVTHASAVIGTLVGSLPTLLGVAVAQASVVAASVTAVLTNTVTALGGGDIEGAWNAVVDGLLGPSGIPGTLLNLSIGAGVQTGPIATPDAAGIEAVFVPSTRTIVQAFVKEITADLQTSPVAPAAAKAERSAASVRSAAADVAPVAAPPVADDATATADNAGTAATDGAAPAEKSDKQRASRKAAGGRDN